MQEALIIRDMFAAMSGRIEQNSYRYWSVRHAMNDYTTILDAATDAYVSGKKISLFVDNLDEGGNIEGFRFGVVDSVS